MLSKLLRSLAIVPALLVVTAVVAAADTTGTGNNMTITVPSSATLIARVAVPVTIQIQCTNTLDLTGISVYNGPYIYSSATVTVSQPAGRTVNSATGYTSQQIACDGATHSYQVSVLASAPFKNGAAAITSQANWSEYAYGCGYVNNNFFCGQFSAQANASAQGPLSLSG
jgi:hypothetical protein